MVTLSLFQFTLKNCITVILQYILNPIVVEDFDFRWLLITLSEYEFDAYLDDVY